MGSYSYASLTTLKAQLGDSATTDDALYREKLEAATEEVDDRCGRTFRVFLATYYLTARCSSELLLPFGLLSLTSLKSDPNGDRTYPDVWDIAGADADVDLLPDDAPTRRRPYWKLATTPNGDYAFPVDLTKGVEAAVKAGFWEDLASVGTVGVGGITDAATTLPLTAGHSVEALHTLLIGSEQLYVTALSGNTATVERGVNGTTAAVHSNLDPVRRYRYPKPVEDVTLVLAEELLRPFGVAGRSEDTQRPAMVVVPQYVEKTLEPYRLLRVA